MNDKELKLDIQEIYALDEYCPSSSLRKILDEAKNEYGTAKVERYERVNDFLDALNK
jgi:hypothetical protein